MSNGKELGDDPHRSPNKRSRPRKSTGRVKKEKRREVPLPILELLAKKDELRRYNDDGVRESFFTVSGIVWRKNALGEVEIVVGDYFDKEVMTNSELRFPTLTSDLNETPRDTLQRVLDRYTGEWSRGKGFCFKTIHQYERKTGIVTDVQIYFLLFGGNNLRYPPIISPDSREGDLFTNKRWMVANQELRSLMNRKDASAMKELLKMIRKGLLRDFSSGKPGPGKNQFETNN